MTHRHDPQQQLPDIVEDEPMVLEEDDSSEAQSSYDDQSVVDSEYPDNELQMLLANTLITSNGEVLADVMAGIRDSLDKLNKILYSKLPGKPQ